MWPGSYHTEDVPCKAGEPTSRSVIDRTDEKTALRPLPWWVSLALRPASEALSKRVLLRRRTLPGWAAAPAGGPARVGEAKVAAGGAS
jgi:hypothetical protein